MPKKTTSKKKKPSVSPRLSNIVKPAGMTPQEWQIALRQQAAEKESFGISEVDTVHSPGEYQVLSPLTGGRYQVLYYSGRFISRQSGPHAAKSGGCGNKW